MPRAKLGFKPRVKNSATLTHSQCRAKVCIICFQPNLNSRDVTHKTEWINKFKHYIGPNFDISNPRLPTGLCNSCRLGYFTKGKDKSFKIPQYLQFVVPPENVDEPCDCAICQKVRPSGTNLGGLRPGTKSYGDGFGRPKKVSTPEVKKSSLKAPHSPGLCKICLR